SGRELGGEYDYKLMLLHFNATEIGPRYEGIDRIGQRGGVSIWQTKVRLPDLERVTKDDEWRLAFYYVGPHSRRLTEHHRLVCSHFASRGWPPIKIDEKLDEFVQCSEVLVLPFGPEAQRGQKQPAEGQRALDRPG